MDKKKILVIDDEADLCELMQMNLESTGEFDVTMAFCGQEGLDKAKAQDFDLVITDFNMPDMNGSEVIDAIRQFKPVLPILLFSVYHDDDSMLSSTIKNKAQGIICKPIDHKELFSKINEILKK